MKLTLEQNLDEAREILDALEKLGISMKIVTDQLEEEGVKAFEEAFTAVVKAVGERQLAEV